MTWWSAHTHSQFSTLDGMSSVPRMVDKVSRMGQPAMALTDHGNMSGTVQLYTACRKFDIAPFPGVEGYLLDPEFDGDLADSSKVGRFHFGLMALDLKGYQALIKFVSKTHTRPRFNRFPRCTLSDLAALGKEAGPNLALTTGCFFGYVQQTLIRKGDAEAEKIVKALATWFPHTFVEVQNHGIDHDEFISESGVSKFNDDMIVDSMADIAENLGLPLLATQDSHYCDQNEKKAHALMKRMVYGGVEDEFPGDSFHLASEEWVADHYSDDVWEMALEGSDHLLSLNKVTIPPLDKFKVHVPELSETPDAELLRTCKSSLRRYLKRNSLMGQQRAYEDRMKEELRVIKVLGVGNYLLHILEIVEWCRRKKHAIEARGSANGSLVCFLIGVTQVDPLKWDTVFERFLSEDRIKPPDIDIDIEDVARPLLLAYVNETYETVQIGTFAELGAREVDQKGSVMASYMQYLRRLCIDEEKDKERKRAEREDRKPVLGKAEEQGKALFRQKFGWIQSLDDVKKYNQKDWIGLKRMAAMKSVRKSYGVHASGVLVAGEDMKIEDWVPTMLVASSDTRVSQYDMDDVEQFGMLKDDFLGQRTLTVMKNCQMLMGREDPTDFSWIPEDDADACRLLREGRTENGIFHFEGYTKAKGGRELGIKNTKDAMLATALYMPGAMESGQKDLYVKRRKSATERKNVTYLHDVFETALKETHGAVIFQEQPLVVLRELGMSMESINKMFKVIKDSGKGAVERNRGRLEELREEFEEYALDAGFEEDDLDEAWHLTTGFMNYGFNRAHAAAYGIRSYRCAYLKAHHTIEFMTALLQCWAGDKKEAPYAREARHMNIRILPPDINISTATWTMDKKKNAIRRGLQSIAGIGPSAAEELANHRPYEHINDVAKRCNPKQVTGGKAWLEEGKLIGTLRKLEDVGALDNLDRG